MATEQTSYDEYSLVWDGALDQIVTVEADGTLDVSYGGNLDVHTLDEWIQEIADASQADDSRPLVEVFCVTHYHAPDFDGECSCAQYETDHTPAYTFNGDDGD